MPAEKTETKEESETASEEDQEQKNRIRIKIKAYDHKLIDESAKNIVKTAKRMGADISGPVPLPTDRHMWTVNRSTFVHDQAKDQFEMRIHKRLIDIYDPSPKLIDSLQDLDLPAGVDIEVRY
jgi:small subunit ribosomal protein S10